MATPAPAPAPAPASSDAAAAAAAAAASSGPSWHSVKVFHPPRSDGPSRLALATIDDPVPTPDELKTAFASSLRGDARDAPLMTRAMRDRLAPPPPKKTFPELRLRVRFPDRTQVEALLPATATLHTVYAFVRSTLTDQARDTPFVLFQTPPRVEFPEPENQPASASQTTTVAQLGWVPNAVLSVKWHHPTLNATSAPAPLRDDLLAQAQNLPPPPNFDAPPPAASHSHSHAHADTDTPSASASSSSKPLPKWLKGIVKK